MMHSPKSSALPRLLAFGLLALGVLAPARAELVVLVDGNVMKVATFEAEGDFARLTYPEPPARMRERLTLVGAATVLGPGAIIASANIGSGEMIFASRGGSIFGYTLLWAFVVAAVTKAALAYSMNRYTVVAGEHLMTRWATLFPGPRGWFPIEQAPYDPFGCLAKS